MERTEEWRAASDDRKEGYLATGAERELFDDLTTRRSDWLSDLDRDFITELNRVHETEREKEQRALRIARHNESVALTALANVEADKRPVNAAKLALAAWPRDTNDKMSPKLLETLEVLGRNRSQSS